MRVSAIKKELDERGVGYIGLFEKSEFVELLLDARAKGITAPPPGTDSNVGGDAAGEGASSGEKTGGKDGFDPSYKEVEVCQQEIKKRGGGGFARSDYRLGQGVPSGRLLAMWFPYLFVVRLVVAWLSTCWPWRPAVQ